MSNNKQSSVNWLVEKLGKYNEEMIFLYQNEIEQAKAMQKKQSVDFALKCMFAHVIPSQATREVIEELFDEYYKEQFGGE